MNRKCIIISGGERCDIPKADSSFFIACDRGYTYAVESGIAPDLIIGDFDSFCGELPSDIEVMKLKCEKDDTDTLTAARYAIKNGFNEVHIYCAFGGRLDHTIANIQCGAFLCSHGVTVTLTGKNETVYFLSNGEICLPKASGCYISLLAFSDECNGVTATGVKYPLCNATLTSRFPLGVSNEWTADKAVISVTCGTLMVVISKETA